MQETFWHYGIVLKSHLPARSSCIILDSHKGKTRCFFPKNNRHYAVLCGGLARYRIHQKGDWHSLSDYTLCKQPALWAKEDLLFLHQLMEVVLYFLPEAQPNYGFFNLLLNLYNPLSHTADHALHRLLFLTKFFLLCDSLPEHFDGKSLQNALSLVYHAKDTMLSGKECTACCQQLQKLIGFFLACNPAMRNMMAKPFKGINNDTRTLP